MLPIRLVQKSTKESTFDDDRSLLYNGNKKAAKLFWRNRSGEAHIDAKQI